MGHKEVVFLHEIGRILERTAVTYSFELHNIPGSDHPWAEDLQRHKGDVVPGRGVLLEYNSVRGSHFGEGKYSYLQAVDKLYIPAHSLVDILVACHLPW